MRRKDAKKKKKKEMRKKDVGKYQTKETIKKIYLAKKKKVKINDRKE